jgi:hypothetical protein
MRARNGIDAEFLDSLAKGMEDGVPDERGDYGDGKVLDRENIAEGEGQRLASFAGAGELAHQKIGIKKKNDEPGLNQGALDTGEMPAAFWFQVHGWMIPAAA